MLARPAGGASRTAVLPKFLQRALQSWALRSAGSESTSAARIVGPFLPDDIAARCSGESPYSSRRILSSTTSVAPAARSLLIMETADGTSSGS